MLEHEGVLLLLAVRLLQVDSEPLEVYDVLRDLLPPGHHENSFLDELQVDCGLFFLVALFGLRLSPRLGFQVLRISQVVDLPDIGVESREVGVEKAGVVLDQLEEVLPLEDVLVLVEVGRHEEEAGVLASQAGHVRPDLEGLPFGPATKAVVPDDCRGYRVPFRGSFVGDVLPLLAVELPGCLSLLSGGLFLAAIEVGVDPVKDSASGNVLLFVVFSLLLLSLADLLNDVPLAFLGPEVVV